MLRHNFLLIYRSFKRFKSTFFINLIGLSTGLATALLIFLWVNDELQFDTFHENDKRLFQVMINMEHSGAISTIRDTPGILAETLPNEFPEIEYAAATTQMGWFQKFTLSAGEKNIKAAGQYVGKDYFNVFSYDLIAGNKDQVLADNNSIVITEELAMKLFNTTENVVGKPIRFQHEKEYIVSGIIGDIPANSSTRFDFALSFEEFKEIWRGWASWGNTGPFTYVVLKEGTNAGQLNAKIADLIKTKNDGLNATLFLKPYSDTYLYGKYENGVQAGGRIAYVQLFSLIAIFILLIACINFMNLSTAKASRRIKEVGVKKAVGAGRKTLVFQYIGESMLMTFLSLLLAVVMVELFLPQFNMITGKQLTLQYSDTKLMLSAISIMLFTGFIAGSYPAFYLSGFNPAMILRGKLSGAASELWARIGLVVFQFVLSIAFIVSVVVVYQQIQFIQTRNMGYDKDNIIYFSKEGVVAEKPEIFLAEVRQIPGVVNAGSIQQNIVASSSSTSAIQWPGKNPENDFDFEIRDVSYEMLETLGVEIKEGQSFSQDQGPERNLIFNEAAIEIMGIREPVGREVRLFGKNRKIVGVVKNFHFKSLHETIGPLVFTLNPSNAHTMMVKIQAGREQETIASLQRFYQAFNPNFSFDYKFLDEDFQAQYVAEKRVAVLSRYFAGLAILISSLGLFGLAAFTAERRLKEIGIRKVLGASAFGIVRLLSADFTKMVLVAIIIALPVSYFITQGWLESFAYRIDLEWWYFAGAGLLALLTAWVTVGAQAIKAALANPVEALRYE